MSSATLLLPAVLFLFVALIVAGSLYGALWLLVTRRQRNLSSPGLLREPARSDALRFEYLSHRLCGTAFCLPLLALVWYAVFTHTHSGDGAVWALAGLAATGVAVLGANVWQLYRLWPACRHHREAVAAQTATARSLNLLMRREYWIFHDVSLGKRRIHHLVMGLRGVFVVESLGRQPRARWQWPKGWVTPPAEAQYDGKCLRLTDQEETAPLDDVRRMARWLSAYLGRVAGEEVSVHAAIALPGWRVTATDWTRAIVFNPSSPNLLIEGGRDGVRLDPYVARTLVQHLKTVQQPGARPARPRTGWLSRLIRRG